MRVLGLLSLVLLGACDRTSLVAPPPPTVEIVPPLCERPAPLLGRFDARSPGYIVDLGDGVDAALETARLAAKYGFEPRHVYTYVLGGFSAELTPTVVAAIRCEATVNSVEFNQLATGGD